MWIFDLFGEILDLRYYKYEPGKWFLDKALGLLFIGCVILAGVGGTKGMPLLLILGIIGTVAFGIASFRIHSQIVNDYYEFREAERAGSAARKKRERL